MKSFYGGVSGAPFQISRIFKSVWYDDNSLSKDSMRYDLELGWASNIGADEFVIVSYGMPPTNNTEQGAYNSIVNLDIKHCGHNFNATLWQKIYEEDSVHESINWDQQGLIINDNFNGKIMAANHWGYKLITSLVSASPDLEFDIALVDPTKNQFSFETSKENSVYKVKVQAPDYKINPNIDVLSADQKKGSITYDKTNGLTFGLPGPWNTTAVVENIPAFDDNGYAKASIYETVVPENSTRNITLKLPNPIKFEAAVDATMDHAGVSVVPSETDDDTLVFKFGFNNPQNFTLKDTVDITHADIANGPWELEWSKIQDYLNENYKDIKAYEILPIRYQQNEYWVYKVDVDEDNYKWGYSRFGGTKLVNEKITDDSTAINATYSAKMINSYFKENQKEVNDYKNITQQAIDALNTIKTMWHIYYDSTGDNAGTAVMLNVAHNVNDDMLVIDGTGTSMCAATDNNTLFISYPEIPNISNQ